MAIPAMKQLFIRLGFSEEAALFFVRGQRLDSIETIRNLDEDHIVSLCKLCRKPGGTIRNPDIPDDPDGAFDGPRTISNPGIPVALREELNLGLCVFFLKHKEMTSRRIGPRDITESAVTSIRIFKKETDKSEAPSTELAPKLSPKRIFDFFGEFRDYLHEHMGTISGRPLSYVIRKSTSIPTGNDPPFGEAGSIYRSFKHEIESRAPIVKPTDEDSHDPNFIQDNIAVWKILWGIVKDTQYVTYVKPFVSKQDGRKAYETLYATLLGPQAINNHASSAENRLSSMTLDGTKKKNWNFDKYVIAHKEQHIVLEKLVEHGYSGIDENSKVRLFLLGITDPKLAVMKSSLCTMKNNVFDDVVASFRNYIETNKTVEKQTRALNISQVNSGYRSANNRNGRTAKASPDSDNYREGGDYSKFKVDVRYYKVKEWNALKPGERNFLREAKRKDSVRNMATKADLKRTNKELRARLAAVTVTEDSSDDDANSKRMTMPKPKRKKLKTLKRGDNVEQEE